MFNLTIQERKVILFLACLALLGTGLDFLLKVVPASARYIQPDRRSMEFDLNRVNQEELEALPGISPKLAARIIAYRSQHGIFQEIAELKEIKGIGEHRYQKLKELFYLGE